MSSGVGPVELVLLVVIGLLVLGPEKLPRVASQIGRWVGKARRTANQLRYQIEREVALADIEKSSKKDKPDQAAAAKTAAAPAAGGSDPSAEAAAAPVAATTGDDSDEEAADTESPAEDPARQT